MALLGYYLTVRVQQHSSGTTNEIIAESTSVNATFTADPLNTTVQASGLVDTSIGGKCKMNVSGDYLLASDGDQFNRLFVHKNAGTKIEVDIYRDTELMFTTEGVLSSLAVGGSLSDALATGAYTMELDQTDVLGNDIMTGWNNTGFWNTFATGWAYITGVSISCDGTSNASTIKNSIWVAGLTYRVSITISLTSGELYPPYDGTNAPSIGYLTSSGTYVYDYTPVAGTNLWMLSKVGDGFDGTITEITIQRKS